MQGLIGHILILTDGLEGEAVRERLGSRASDAEPFPSFTG